MTEKPVTPVTPVTPPAVPTLSVVPAERWSALPHEFRTLCLKEALLLPPSPAASYVVPWTPLEGSKAGGIGDLDVAIAIAAWRWLDLMRELLLGPRSSALLQELCTRTRQGQQVPAPEALADMRQRLGDLIQDGGPALLSLPVLRATYAKFTTALCRLCCYRLELEKPEEKSLGACLRHFCAQRQSELQRVLRDLSRESVESRIELLCCQVMRLDFFEPEAFLQRGICSARPRQKAMEDLKVYLVWSARKGFSAAKHALAYWRLAECFVEELEFRTATQGALLEDRTFHSLVEHAEISLNLAIRYDGGRQNLGSSAASQHLLQRLETLRSARRTAVEFLDAPLIAGGQERVDAARSSGSSDAYAVLWPMDLTAGIPDQAIFSRRPNIGSSQSQRPMELLFLGCEGVLDIMATLSNLTVRAAAFANLYPECLHWKYRPKPVHLHLHAATVERLAQSLLCFMIMKQIGEKADESSVRHRWLCSLLTAVIFCRCLTAPQRKEVDRLLQLLILAAGDSGSMSRAFPWLELDDDRKTTLPMGKMGAEGTSKSDLSTSREPREEEGSDWRRVQDQLQEIEEEGLVDDLKAPGAEENFTSSHLLFQLQQVWLGWLGSASQEVSEENARESPTPSSAREGLSLRTSPSASEAQETETRLSFGFSHQVSFQDEVPDEVQQLDVAEVHRAARRSFLGERAAATYEALHTAGHAQVEELSQRRWWALRGFLPAAEASGMEQDDRGFQDLIQHHIPNRVAEEDQPEHMRPPNLRAVWHALLEEVALEKAWRLNPCVLEHVTWRYDPSALADPFLTFSWYLHKKSGHGAEGWPSCVAAQGKPFDEPLDPQKVPVLERIWEHLYPQMKRIGSIFHALEARDNSWAMDMRRSLTEERTQAPTSGNQQTSGNRRMSRGAYRTAAAKCSPVSAYFHVKVSQELRERVAQEEEERTIELAKSDILGELEELKRRRRDLSLELELRDYVTLASMKEKEADWWGQAARNAAAYGQLDAQMATWKPAPEDCAPLRLRIFGYAGRPWHVLKAVAFRGATFDAIDAPNLHEGVGLLGLSTWFDMLLKQVPHSYIQTRHCEDFFVDRLEQHLSSEWAPMSIRAAVQSQGGSDVKFSKTMPGTDFKRSAQELAGLRCRDVPSKPRAVLMPNGLAGRPGETKTPSTPRTFSPPSLDQRLQLSLCSSRTRAFRKEVLSSKPKTKSFPEYSAESKFFEHLSRQSITTKASAVQLQLLLGMAFRCEPIMGDLGLIYLGAANLRPARRDFLPWDSILATSFDDWPGDVSQFSEEALGGTKSVPLHESRQLESATGDSLCVSDVAALIVRHTAVPSDERKATALGCRVLRLRKLCGTGHPSLSWDAEDRRCSNAAFCTRRVEPLDYTGNEGKSYCCTKCKSAYYCSKLCQSSHFVAHQFECKSLRQLRVAAQNLRSMAPQQLRVTLAEVLEELLAKQVSSQSHLEATTLCPSVHESLTGQFSHGAPESLEIGSKEVALPALPTHVLHRGQSRASGLIDVKLAMGCSKLERKKEVQIAGNCVVLLPQEQFQWKVQKRKESDEPEMQASEEELLKRRSRRMFSAQHSNVHTAVGIVRLMSRWANMSHSLQAIKEVTEDGLFFYLITGLCLTEHFAKRQMSPETMMAILSHRMALHVAASQDWSLVPMMRPPLELQEMGVSALDVAQYSAYYAFLKHRRLPFGELRPLMPIIAMVWGNRARDALLALPHLLEPTDGKHPNRSTGRNSWRRGSRLGSFADVAREHFGEIQLVDSVQLDVYTGRAWFLLSDSVNVSAPTRLAGVETWILLLDASRGLQAVSCPVPASELRRCAL